MPTFTYKIKGQYTTDYTVIIHNILVWLPLYTQNEQRCSMHIETVIDSNKRKKKQSADKIKIADIMGWKIQNLGIY